MKGFNLLKAHLQSFETNRRELNKEFDGKREAYAELIADCFMDCARGILAGHFQVVNAVDGAHVVRKIYPIAIELYYHEEGEGRFKDPIMYHTKDRKAWYKDAYFEDRGIDNLPYYPIGSLNPHTSGIDITFENPKEQYRASFLIREYEVEYETGKRLTVKNSTDIYDDMLLNGICLDNADWIEWCDGTMLNDSDILRQWRRNVPDYRPTEDKSGKWEKNPDGEITFSSAGGKFAKCPFNWQFRKK